MYVKLLKEKQMKKGLKIAAIVVGVIIILMLLLLSLIHISFAVRPAGVQ